MQLTPTRRARRDAEARTFAGNAIDRSSRALLLKSSLVLPLAVAAALAAAAALLYLPAARRGE
jgi:hypothetical protein